MSETRVPYIIPLNTIYGNKAENDFRSFEAGDGNIIPGMGVANLTAVATVGLVYPVDASAGAGETLTWRGVAGDNKHMDVTSGLPFDPVDDAYPIGYDVDVITKGPAKVVTAAGVTAGQQIQPSTTAGQFDTYAAGLIVGRALTTATAGNAFLLDVNAN